MATSTITSNADYIVEQGTSGIWAYRKWNSGVYEAWASKSFDSLDLTSQNSGTYYGPDKTLALPSFSLTCTSAIGQINGGSLSSGIYLYRILRTSQLAISFRAHTSISNGAAGIDIYIKGTWK